LWNPKQEKNRWDKEPVQLQPQTLQQEESSCFSKPYLLENFSKLDSSGAKALNTLT